MVQGVDRDARGLGGLAVGPQTGSMAVPYDLAKANKSINSTSTQARNTPMQGKTAALASTLLFTHLLGDSGNSHCHAQHEETEDEDGHGRDEQR